MGGTRGACLSPNPVKCARERINRLLHFFDFPWSRAPRGFYLTSPII